METGELRRWLEAADDPAPLVVETSGSTGRPKRVVLPRRAVLASVVATERRLGGSGRWALKLPPSYVAGLQVVCRSLVAGHEPFTGEGWPEGVGWFTSLVPTQLRRLLDDEGEVEALRRAHTVLLGGGPADPALRTRAAEAGVRVVATYGAAETAGGCVYDGVPLDGVGVRIAVSGRIEVTGPTLFAGYEGEPGLTAEVLVDGWFRTADAGRIDDDGRLQVLGRLDDVVVSGGVNVPGPAVAARLRAHPAVRDAEVVGVPDEEWGHRLVAFVVGPVSEAEARAWVAAEHPRSWAPRQVVGVEEIPLLANGKPDRVRLRALAGAAS
ncbi:AMP-binding protein [Nocardioides litoris]|uniref:AMP-binding protein n=1 Tax=Nocardioides litoris TaxID=1926648 RepID=UPI00111E16E6|nr:AMP-binding protein [Nocardioides litoris]